jgi:hypothetical protein
MDRLGLHASGRGEIYSSSSFWQQISTVLLDNRFEGAWSLLAHRDPHTRLEAMRSSPWHEEIRKGAFEAANQILLKKGNKVARFKVQGCCRVGIAENLYGRQQLVRG